jgi:hypothetical protein
VGQKLTLATGRYSKRRGTYSAGRGAVPGIRSYFALEIVISLLRAEVTGEPALLGVCHCTECQRRAPAREGPSKVYVRGAAFSPGMLCEVSFGPILLQKSSSVSHQDFSELLTRFLS